MWFFVRISDMRSKRFVLQPKLAFAAKSIRISLTAEMINLINPTLNKSTRVKLKGKDFVS